MVDNPPPVDPRWFPVEYQERFIRSFLAPDAPRAQLLVAQPGTGKTATACRIVDAMMTAAVGRRILVLAPKLATMQYAHVLKQERRLPVLQVDRMVFRELEA